MTIRQRLVILDASWEIRNVGMYVDDVLVEYQEYGHLRNTFIELVILSRLNEISLMFASAIDTSRTLPSSLWRYLYSVPSELRYRIDREMYKREFLMRSRLGERDVTKITIKVNESLLEIEC